MLQSVEQQLKELGIVKEEKILLAVSGGVDSMVLWHLVEQLGQEYAVAHVNFSLRGEESDEDEKLVHAVGQQRKIRVHSQKANTNEYAQENGLSTQMAAREIRYNWFEELIADFAYKTIATAHHLEDSIETFLINLNRGTGIKGLIGIGSNQKRFRPLLNFSKAEIREYAKSNNIRFREDRTNDSTKYERNWFRHKILGPWKEHNPQFLESMRLTLRRMQAANASLSVAIGSELKRIRNEALKGKISLDTLDQLQHKKEVLYEFLSSINFTESQVDNLLLAIEQKAVGKAFHSSQFAIQLDRSSILIKSKEESIAKNSILIPKGTTKVEQPVKLLLKTLEAKSFQLHSKNNTEGFDLDKLQFPLELRPWQKGDYMTPLGMKGRKKVSDLLIDEKVPLFEKEKIFVLCSNQEIVWLMGLRISEKFKVEKNSNKVLQVEWKKN